MPLYISAIVHPCRTKDVNYKGYHLTKGNVSSATSAPFGVLDMQLEHNAERSIGRWLHFQHDEENDRLIGSGVIDETTRWGAYAIQAIREGKMTQFSITYDCEGTGNPQVDAMNAHKHGVKKKEMTEVSLCVKGAFDGCHLLAVTDEVDPAKAAPIPPHYERRDANLPEISCEILHGSDWVEILQRHGQPEVLEMEMETDQDKGGPNGETGDEDGGDLGVLSIVEPTEEWK